MGTKRIKSKGAARNVRRVTAHRRTRTTGSKAAKAREYLVKCLAAGHQPTYTEIQNATGVGDTTQVFRKLAADGVITYTPGDYTSARLCTPLEADGSVVVKLSPAVLSGMREQLCKQRAEVESQIASIDSALEAATARSA